MLQTKCMFSEREEKDGYRIIVAGRLTMDDGVTPLNFPEGHFDEHAPIMAPDGVDYWAYYKKRINFEELMSRYRKKLEINELVKLQLHRIGEMAKDSVVTLMCFEDTPESCHRKVLAEYIHSLFPEIELNIQ